MVGISLTMLIAGLLGGYMAQMATGSIRDDLTKLVAGIAVGLLAGVGVGFLTKLTWDRFIITSPER